MNVEELWHKYDKTKDKSIKGQLIENYIGLVKIIAGRMYNYYASKLDYEDLVGYGIIGLIDSIERFDINKNIKFETYAQIRIKGTIIDNIRKLDWIPRSLRKKSKDIQNETMKLENKLGRTPSNKELAEYLNIALEELEDTLSDTANFNVTSLDDLLINRGEYNIKNDNTYDLPENIVENNELIRIVGEIIDELPENQRTILSLYYYEELTYKEISEIVNLSESRISQINSKAIITIRNKLHKMGIY